MSLPVKSLFEVVTACRVQILKRSRELHRAVGWLGKWCPEWSRRRGDKFFHCVLYFEAGPAMKRIIVSKSTPQLADLLADFNSPQRIVWQFPEAEEPSLDAPSTAVWA